MSAPTIAPTMMFVRSNCESPRFNSMIAGGGGGSGYKGSAQGYLAEHCILYWGFWRGSRGRSRRGVERSWGRARGCTQENTPFPRLSPHAMDRGGHHPREVIFFSSATPPGPEALRPLWRRKSREPSLPAPVPPRRPPGSRSRRGRPCTRPSTPPSRLSSGDGCR